MKIRSAKLKKCKYCNMHPVFMSVTSYSGYVTCIQCLSSTKTYDDDLNFYKTWKDKATEEWNSNNE